MDFKPLARSSSKWRRFPEDVIPMHVAEMDFEVAPEIRQVLQEMVSKSDLGYLGPIPEVAQSFSKFAKERWNWDIDKSRLKLATDVGVAAVEILRLVTSPGDKVMINSPVYSSFQGWIKEVRAEVFDVPLHRNGESWRLDLEGIEKAFAEGVKVYLLCSPQNPVGRVHSAKELAEIARLANKYEALVISDEIHAPLSWDEFTPYLALGPGAEQTGVTITSSSKAWNTAGLKAAFLITQSDRVAERLKGLPDAMHWRSSLLGAFAMAVSFKDSVGWLDETNNQIQANYEFLKKQLSQALPKASVAQMDSTYLAWIDLSAYSVENPAVEILKRGRVSLVPGEDHGGGERFKKFVRLNFATTQDRIAETVRRMALVLES